jgi:hypothetical protein
MRKKSIFRDSRIFLVKMGDGITRKYSDIVDHGDCFTARLVGNDGKLGQMVHRISREEMETATIEQNKNEQE